MRLWACAPEKKKKKKKKKKQSKSLGFDRIYVWEKERKKESMRENDRIIRKKVRISTNESREVNVEWRKKKTKKKMFTFSIKSYL